MGRSLDLSKTAGEVSTESGGSFAPLAAGKYEATIVKVDEGVYKSVANKGLENINVQFKISPGQVGANRRVFHLVPLAPNWLNGNDAFAFHQFFSAVEGISEKDFRIKVKAAKEAKEDLDLPDDVDLLGAEVTITLKVEDDDYKFKKAKTAYEALSPAAQAKSEPPKQADFQKNTISGVEVAGKGNMDKDDDDGAPAGAVKAKAKTVVLDL